MKRIATHRNGLAVLALLAAAAAVRRIAVSSLDGRPSRRALMRSGGLGLVALAVGAWRSRALAARRTGAPSRAVGCVLTPEQTEGPYYIAKEKVRSNIVEHRPGTPLALRLTVVDAATCAPLKGAAVDVWHCDAAGIYSGFERASAGASHGGAGGPPPGGPPPPGQGGPGAGPGAAGPTDKDTFLRGIQVTDARGECAFRTIYPGWYTGRTVHIHVKVHLGGAVVHTGQLYFPDSLTDRVYQKAPYKARAAARDTRNGDDAIYRNGGAQSMLTVTRSHDGGYIGAITLGVRRS